MAVACAAAELLGRRALDLDLVMLIEGEEEAGSGGFAEAVKRNKVCCYGPSNNMVHKAEGDCLRRRVRSARSTLSS